MNIYDANGHTELRTAVVALCVEMGKSLTSHTTASITREAERIVPPVQRVLREYKGVTYDDGLFWCADGCNYPSAAQCISDNATAQPSNKQVTLTDDDHAALILLKKYPTKPVQWDGNSDEANRLFGDAYGVDWVHTNANPTVTPPTRERVEPTTVRKELGDLMVEMCRKVRAGEVVMFDRLYERIEALMKPATIDDAIALLVREGWVDKAWYASREMEMVCMDKDRVTPLPVRVLIAPTPERAS